MMLGSGVAGEAEVSAPTFSGGDEQRGFDSNLRDVGHDLTAYIRCMTQAPPIDTDAAWIAFEARDRRADGRFVVAVHTTGIYCKPSCPARRPKH
ncbi:hypothetical protein BH10PSE15_BH10PSE15_03390 [soil metagenome]